MKTDKEIADAVRAASKTLQDVIGEAEKAGLIVEINSHTATTMSRVYTALEVTVTKRL